MDFKTINVRIPADVYECMIARIGREMSVEQRRITITEWVLNRIRDGIWGPERGAK